MSRYMKRECAWCGKDMGKVKVPEDCANKFPTHGICKDCLKEQMKKINEMEPKKRA